jgi:hypothetical protein
VHSLFLLSISNWFKFGREGGRDGERREVRGKEKRNTSQNKSTGQIRPTGSFPSRTFVFFST